MFVDIKVPQPSVLQHKSDRLTICLGIRSACKTRRLLIVQIEVTRQDRKQHPEKDLLIGADRVVFNDRDSVLANAIYDAGELGFRDRRHTSSSYITDRKS